MIGLRGKPINVATRCTSVHSVSNGSGGVLWSHSRGVVRFSDARGLLRNALRPGDAFTYRSMGDDYMRHPE